jgi:Pvc16 N-terminal domain
MINTVLKILKDELIANHLDESEIVIGDIAKDEGDSSPTSDKIVITLLSVEEEKTLKNNPRYERVQNPDGDSYVKKNLPAYLNLYVMIAGNKNSYDKSIDGVSKVIETFQTRKEALAIEHNFRMQLHSLPFDQLSYAWGFLGGKILPSVLYKISIIKIQNEENSSEARLIKNVDIQSAKK